MEQSSNVHKLTSSLDKKLQVMSRVKEISYCAWQIRTLFKLSCKLKRFFFRNIFIFRGKTYISIETIDTQSIQ